jgi:hypothetical protein
MMEQEASRNLEGLEIGALDASELEEALGVISRGMRDNPIHIAAFGEDPERRKRSLRRLFGAAFAVMGLHKHMLVARSEEGAIVGVMGMMPPGDSLPGPGQQLRMFPSLLRNGPRAAGRTMRWLVPGGSATPTSATGTSVLWRWMRTCRGGASARSYCGSFVPRWTRPEGTLTWRPTSRSMCVSTSGSASRWSASRRCWAFLTGSCSGEQGGGEASKY